jgi:hypothetical protein
MESASLVYFPRTGAERRAAAILVYWGLGEVAIARKQLSQMQSLNFLRISSRAAGLNSISLHQHPPSSQRKTFPQDWQVFCFSFEARLSLAAAQPVHLLTVPRPATKLLAKASFCRLEAESAS